jgi:glycerophosphoryl diester phosphodiesterase
MPSPAIADPTSASPTAAAPRPFYLVGHNTNTLAEVQAALAAGANALEPDINFYADRPGAMCVSHDAGDASALSLNDFLDAVHAIALASPQLALVVFDCKAAICNPAHGAELLAAIRSRLTHDTGVNVVISVGDFDSVAVFERIHAELGPREGLMIDEENDPEAVSAHFDRIGVVNHCFGNGISVFNDILGPNVRPSMERGCAFRAATDKIRFIYVWTVNDAPLMAEYIHIGVDGIISDDVPALRSVVDAAVRSGTVRIANRADNPMQRPNQAYALDVLTSDEAFAGTDALIRFTLTGAAGSAQTTVNARFRSRMESGHWNFVTLASSDLGELKSIAVSHDESGLADGWHVARIRVRSARYGAAGEAVFERWVKAGEPVTVDFA